MSSREQILAAARANRPDLAPEPEIPDFGGESTLEKFQTILESIGGRVVRLENNETLEEAIRRLFPAAQKIASNLIKPTETIEATSPKAALEAIDLAVLNGEFGVAENGAVWMPEKNMLHRSLPFITQHLVLVIPETAIVATMHDAYARMGGTGGYGVFIAGPSKTADIEQSLVIGAHGARSMTLLLI
ncbi:LutC/YkgG family protein [Tellurirhabdus bombi]|uniref:LutC/YkgG family protein n=1 Tax=Tellurirhabdus bombi TaxID=2907205 RepID=UPI001F492D23|nr:LUD domain-containing protein [Tellurirhabdus bombi]